MTEAGWLGGADLREMLALLAGEVVRESRHGVVRTPVPEAIRRQTSDRKFRLLAVALYRRHWPLLGTAGRRVVGVAERQADSPAGRAEAAAVRRDLHEAETPFGLWSISDQGLFGAERAHEQVLTHLARLATAEAPGGPGPAGLIEIELAAQAAIVRDVFGNPFDPVLFDTDWLTSTATAVARGIYDERAFDRLPMLADALRDAGCWDERVLGHCRGDVPHARGCWVVDSILRKQ